MVKKAPTAIVLNSPKENRNILWLKSGALHENYGRPVLEQIKVGEKISIAVNGFVIFIMNTPKVLLQFVGKFIKLGKMNVGSSAVSVEVDTVDTAYPNYQNVIPNEKPTMTFALSADLLRLAMKDYKGSVIFRVYAPNKPFELSMGNEADDNQRYVVLMPMHLTEVDNSFYRPIEPKETNNDC